MNSDKKYKDFILIWAINDSSVFIKVDYKDDVVWGKVKKGSIKSVKK